MSTETKANQLDPGTKVADAYLKELALLRRRLEAAVERAEKAAERIELTADSLKEDVVLVADVFSRKLLEKGIHEQVEEDRRRMERQKRFPHPGGFDAKGRVAKIRERTEASLD